MQIHEILYTCTQDLAFPTLKIWLRSLHCKVFDNHINTVCQKIAISKMCQIAGALQVYKGRTEKFTEEELKRKIRKCWKEISLGEVQKAVGSWKKRLRLVYKQDGGPIDHLL